MIQGPSVGAIIGRDREMALLREALAATLTGRGRLVLISGEPGIGKTTLAAALSDEVARRGVDVSTARAPETAGAPPYWLWIQALRSDNRTSDIAAQRSLAARYPMLARILLELAASQGEFPPALATESDAERFRLADEIASFLLSSALERPRVLVLDDIHAADASSLEVLAHVSSRLDSGPLLIVAAHRDAPDDVTHALEKLLAHVSRQHSTVRIPLTGFDVPVVRTQLTQVVGHEIDVQLAQQVHTRTGGNPFFVAEVGRLLIGDTGDATTSAAAVPPQVRDVITWRLKRLSEGTHTVLQYAALVGISARRIGAGSRGRNAGTGPISGLGALRTCARGPDHRRGPAISTSGVAARADCRGDRDHSRQQPPRLAARACTALVCCRADSARLAPHGRGRSSRCWAGRGQTGVRRCAAVLADCTGSG